MMVTLSSAPFTDPLQPEEIVNILVRAVIQLQLDWCDILRHCSITRFNVVTPRTLLLDQLLLLPCLFPDPFSPSLHRWEMAS